MYEWVDGPYRFEVMECAFQVTFARASTGADTTDKRADTTDKRADADAVTIAPTTLKMIWPSSQVDEFPSPRIKPLG